MTRQTVRNAYSGVKPSQEQKDKMWNAIMAQKDTRPVEVSRIKPSGGFRFSNLAAPLGLAAVLALAQWLPLLFWLVCCICCFVQRKKRMEKHSMYLVCRTQRKEHIYGMDSE